MASATKKFRSFFELSEEPSASPDARAGKSKLHAERCCSAAITVLCVISSLFAVSHFNLYRSTLSDLRAEQADAAVDAAAAASALLEMASNAADEARMHGHLTAPLPNVSAALTFIAHGSCANQEIQTHNFWNQLARLQPQLFVFNGDIVYGDCDGPAFPNALSTECSVLSGAWSRLFAKTNFGAVRANLPMLGVLDDHDYGQNDCGEDNPFKYLAKALFLQRWNALPTDPRWARQGVYMSSMHGPVGQRTQILLTDTRWSKSPYVPSYCVFSDSNRAACAGRERYVPYNASNGGSVRSQDGGPRMMSEEQWAWLETELRKPAELRLLFSTVQVLAEGHGWERWGLIPLERRRLFELINATGANGVVLFSGDRHVGAHYRVPRGVYGAPYPMNEITSSSLTHSYRGTPGPWTAGCSGSRTVCADPNDENASGPDGLQDRITPLVHENHLGTIRVNWVTRNVSLQLLASDDCGVAPQSWGQQCSSPGSGVAGRVLLDVTLSLDELRVR